MTLAEEMQQLEAGQFDEALEILDSLRDTENIDEILTEYFDKNSENLFNKNNTQDLSRSVSVLEHIRKTMKRHTIKLAF